MESNTERGQYAGPPASDPIDRVWRSLLNRSITGVLRPGDAPVGKAHGPNPDRMLVLGCGPAVGYGLRSHQDGLAGHIAKELSGITRCGAVVDVVADPSMTVSSAPSSLRSLQLDRYDAVVVALGTTDGLRFLRVSTFRKRVTRLLRLLTATTTPRARIVLVGIQPVRSIPSLDNSYGGLVDRHARRLNTVLCELAADHEQTSFTPLPPPPRMPAGDDRAAADHRYWAEVIVAHLAPKIMIYGSQRHEPPFISAPASEAARISAVHALSILDTEPEARFDRIVELARSLFNTKFAAITLVDGNRQWMKSAAGMTRQGMPREQSFCQFTIRDVAATVIPDSRREIRTRKLDATKAGVVFYAGSPLRGPTGHLVGALCVFDTDARDLSTVDSELLHDLAMLAQRELWKTPELEERRLAYDSGVIGR